VYRTNMITTSSSNSASHNHESLGVDQEQAPETQATTLYTGSMSMMHPYREGSLDNKTHLPGSTRLGGRTTFQCKFVFSSQRHVNNFLKLISINKCNFRFTKIEVAKTITSMMKIPLFQLSHVSKYPK